MMAKYIHVWKWPAGIAARLILPQITQKKMIDVHAACTETMARICGVACVEETMGHYYS
jgi:hypothetical protein